MAESGEPVDGIWVCSYADGSAYAVFNTELEALRYAVDNGMSCEFTPWGRI